MTIFVPQRWNALRTRFDDRAWRAARAAAPASLVSAGDLVRTVIAR